MKKRFYLIYGILGVVALEGCNALLNVEPEEYVSDQGIIVDQSSAENALNGAYRGAGSGLASSIVSWNIAADNIVSFSRQGTIIAYLQPSVAAADRTNGYGYNGNYTAINRANAVIANVQTLSRDLFAGNSMEKILAQAFTLRALSYINLTVTFGAVPIVIQPSTATNQNGIKQSSRKDVFAQILSDLDQAETLFGSDQSISDKGRISLWAVYALKARVYLYTGQWEEAEQYAAKIINNTSLFGLTDTPEGFFLTKKSRESIFEFVYSNANKLPFRTYYWPSTIGGMQDYCVPPDLYNKLNDPEIGGNRRQLIFYGSAAQSYFVNEYALTDGSSSIQTARLAEQYLIRAEARLKKAIPDRNGAIEDINAIKTRAGVPLL
ncbi:MAG: RagB/SusD family nutrient uptake outer membrane protein, partial [Bacteroidetes bacterium]|nr:RagB/SusD family nutrient uptake outer membrane protein [Bacteroidota bacterium]